MQLHGLSALRPAVLEPLMNSTALSGLALAGAMCIGNTPQAPPKRLDAVCCRVGKGAAKF